MLLRKIDVPQFIKIENGLTTRIRNILEKNILYPKNIMLITTNHLYQLFKEKIKNSDIENSLHIIYIQNSNIIEVEKVKEIIQKYQSELIIGFGGGKVIDVAKYSAYLEKETFLSMPTTLSHDGISSPVAVINFGTMKRSLGARMPIGVVCDMDVIIKAPIKTLRAGVGDLISNLSAIEDWKLAVERGKEKFDDFAFLLAKYSAEHIFNLIPRLRNDPFLRELAQSLILSGVAMEVAGSSRPCSGAEHEFSHALDYLIPNKNSLHGEQVAMGTVLTSYLRGEDFQKYKDFFRDVGLPLNYKEINVPKEKIVEALVYAPKTRLKRYTILEDIKIDRAIAEKACRVTGVI